PPLPPFPTRRSSDLSAISQSSMLSIRLSTVIARRPSKNPISTKSHTTAQSLTFIELSLSAILATPPSAAARCRLHIVGRGLRFRSEEHTSELQSREN